MTFNRTKTKIMFHTQIKKFSKWNHYMKMENVKSIKMLGFNLNAHANNIEHTNKIKEKKNKIIKMMYICQNGENYTS